MTRSPLAHALALMLIGTSGAAQQAAWDFASSPTRPTAAYSRLLFATPQSAATLTAASDWGAAQLRWVPLRTGSVFLGARLEGAHAPTGPRRDSTMEYGAASLSLGIGGPRASAWAALGAGELRDGVGNRLVGRGSVGGSVALGHFALQLTLSGAQIAGGTRTYTSGGSPGIDTLGIPPAPPVVSQRAVPARVWRELTSSLAWAGGPIALQLIGGRTTALTGTKHWLRSDAAVWIRHDVAVVAALGNPPLPVIDVQPPVPSFSVGLRIALGRAVQRNDASRNEGAAPFSVTRFVGDVRKVRIELRGAKRVELTADFVDWRVLPLSYAGADIWEAALPIRPGNHRISIRVNGGEWQAPPGLTSAEDDFGVMTGLLHID